MELVASPSYEALSYTWGDPQDTRTIHVGGAAYGHDISPRGASTRVFEHPYSSQLVQSSEPSTWPEGWAVKQADMYWGSASYWLFQLAIEEYWKRCWIVQEIGSALAVDVYAGPQPIPWRSFIQLMRLYEKKLPSGPAHRVTRLDDLRASLYQDGETYMLERLLESFVDSFCSVSLDKVLAFSNLAVDCQEDCLPIDYQAGTRPLYEAVIAFQNISSYNTADKSIDMVHFAGLVRRLLAREQQVVVKTYETSGLIYQPGTWSYWLCGDENFRACMGSIEKEAEKGKTPTITLIALLDIIPRIFTEVKEYWSPESNDNGGLRVTGLIIGEVQEFGPTYTAYLQDTRASRHWSSQLIVGYPAEADLRRALGLNGRLTALLGAAADFRLHDVLPLPKFQGQESGISAGPRLFLGSDITMGLIPSNALIGDVLCQFWNSPAVAVLRRRVDGVYDVVGRGAVVKHGDAIDWDTPTNRTQFDLASNGTIQFRLDLETLNHLSFDVVNLPGSE
ncbi:putative Heterokaryon incompatibility protein-domain-containing protein [Seiridium unicorne]|uniref:Heterokaryon incompatibility protein-domain-containing protein n=1 Tax=Seiridium unicorne TaxID=138068 RepID=A0ABR2V907_9PEZI